MIFDMERKRTLKLVAAGGMAMSLQGCIAAAFPLAAGGLMAGGGRTESEPPTEVAAAPEAVPVEVTRAIADADAANAPAPTGSVEVGTGSSSANGVFRVEEAASSEPAVAEVAAVPEATRPASAGGEAAANTQAGVLAVPTNRLAVVPSNAEAAQTAPEVSEQLASAQVASTTPLAATPPAPAVSSSASSSIVVPVPQAAPAVAGGTFFDPLFAYSGSAEFAGSGARDSAILRNPAMLEPDRTRCTQGVSTVLIDLDPEEGELLPVNPQSASPALAQRLAQLRLKGVIIAWISENSIEKTNEIRAALRASGLDPLGIDEVLLMRTSEERKQSRRDELARNSCLIAIAGDTRSDFHELFGYLLNPSDAIALEPLIGEGWFLIPTPLLSERPAR